MSAHLLFWSSLVFAGLCIAYAGFGFSSIDAGASAEEIDNARGYAWFWMFLGGVGGAMALMAWLLGKGKFGGLDD